MKEYAYKWSFNLGINPVHWVWIKIWIGSRSWWWQLNRPLRIRRGSI